jgi:hypothetical protein
MGSLPQHWPKLEPMSTARLRQPSLAETSAKPVPAFVPGQLHLFIEPDDFDKTSADILRRVFGDFMVWKEAWRSGRADD